MYSHPAPIILASTSPYRRSVLQRLGIAFTCLAPRCDEANPDGLPPLQLARCLAERKARAVQASPAALVIGSDQVVDCDGSILGKPGSREAAETQLQRLQGRNHRLITAVAVHDTQSGRMLVDHDIHTLTMRPLTQMQIANYVAHDQPVDCAGSYKLERRGIALFTAIAAEPPLADATAVEGLPLARLCRLLQQLGHDVLDAPA